MTTIINLEVGIIPICYGQNILADEMYFDNPIVHALVTIYNPWNMEEVISSLTMPSKPVLLTRQVNCLKYNQYDMTGYVVHRRYSIENGHVTEHQVESPFKRNFDIMKTMTCPNIRPDSFIEDELHQDNPCHIQIESH